MHENLAEGITFRIRTQCFFEESDSLGEMSVEPVRMNVETAIRTGTKQLMYEDLKDKQMEALCSFLNGNDVFFSLQTGFGKTIIYATLPFAFHSLPGRLTE